MCLLVDALVVWDNYNEKLKNVRSESLDLRLILMVFR